MIERTRAHYFGDDDFFMTLLFSNARRVNSMSLGLSSTSRMM
jgi:hypothetical protein